MRRPTIAELQREIETLKCYREAWYCRSLPGVRVDIPESNWPIPRAATHIIVRGLHRAAGGIVEFPEGGARYVEDWIRDAENESRDPYYREAAGKVRRFQYEAIMRRQSNGRCVAHGARDCKCLVPPFDVRPCQSCGEDLNHPSAKIRKHACNRVGASS